MSFFYKFSNLIYKVTKIIVKALLIVALIATFSQVIARYVFSHPLRFTEELSRYAFIWMCFLGASMAFKTRTNISIDTIAVRLPKRFIFWCDIIFQLIIILFFIITISGSLEHVIKLGIRKSVGLQIQMKYLYSAIFISFALMLIYTVEKIIRKIILLFNFHRKRH